MVGIDKPIFNPREPSSLAQVGVSPLTGAGNLWLWLPQARVEQDFAFTNYTGLRARVGVVETHETSPYNSSGHVPGGGRTRTAPAPKDGSSFIINLDTTGGSNSPGVSISAPRTRVGSPFLREVLSVRLVFQSV